MSTPVDERLRDALGAQAAATTVDPDGWERIRRRTARRRPAWARPGLVAPALAVVALVLGAVALAPGDDASRLRAAAPPGRLYLVPSLPGFALASVTVDPDFPPAPARRLRVFGRRAPDGVTFAASVVVTIGDPLEPGDEPAVPRMVTWREGDRAVSLTTFGLSDAEAAAVEASLRAGPADVAPPRLPGGFVTVVDQVLPSAPARFVDQEWRNGRGGSFEVVLAEDAGARLDVLAAQTPGAVAVRVRGNDGLLLPDGGGLTWLERPGTAVSVFGPGLGPAELQAVAESLEEVDEAAWRRLMADVPSRLPAGPPAEPVDLSGAVTIGEGEADGAAWQALVHPSSSPGGGSQRCVLVKTAGRSGGFCHDDSVVAAAGAAEVTVVADRFLAGRVGAGVARVRVLLAGGATVEAVPAGADAGIAAGYFVAVLPAGSATEAVVTLDGAGRELRRTPLPGGRPPG